jgi:thioredoxin-dependent peroxiredoxin
MTLAAGERAPDVSLYDGDGKTVALASFRGAPLVLYFYPKDNTPGCTAQACAFRDAYQDFTDAGAVVVGVSGDDGASHAGFAEKHHLPFTLLSDRGGAAQKAFGIPKTLGILPGRVTFVIDRDGVIQHTFNSQFLATKHIGEALAALGKLKAPA